jgi:putative SOS response-associated peptidase YedK
MCGRYTITVTMEELLEQYLLEWPMVPFHRPRYNVAPGQLVPAIIHDGQKRRIGELKWGLVPSWAKDDKQGFKMINARAETIEDRPAYATLLRRKRCLIPADSFYEWRKSGGSKTPMRILLKSRRLFSLAGLYDTWVAPTGNKLSTCTVITTSPNELMAEIHNRMPVILDPEAETVWLDRGRHTDELRALLQPYPSERMEAYPVSPIVGNVKNETKECIEPVLT